VARRLRFSGETYETNERLFINGREVPRWLFRIVERTQYFSIRVLDVIAPRKAV